MEEHGRSERIDGRRVDVVGQAHQAGDAPAETVGAPVVAVGVADQAARPFQQLFDLR